MLEGRLDGDFDAIEFFIRSRASSISSGGAGLPTANSHDAQCACTYIDMFGITGGLLLSVSSSSVTNDATFTYSGPAGTHTITNAGFDDDITLLVRIEGPVRTDGSIYKHDVTACKVYVNGTLHIDLGAALATSLSLMPATIKFIGNCPRIGGSISYAYNPPSPYSNYDWTTGSTQIVNGGWRLGNGASYYAPAITLLSMPSTNLEGRVTGTNTWDIEITNYYSKRVNGVWHPGSGTPPGPVTPGVEYIYEWEEIYGGSIAAFPSLGASLDFMNTDYACMWHRNGFPKTQSERIYTYELYDNSQLIDELHLVTSTNTDTLTQVHARYPSADAVVDSTTHTILDPLGRVVYAPIRVTYAYSQQRLPDVVPGGGTPPTYAQPAGWPNAEFIGDSFEFPTTVDTSGDNADLASYLYSSDLLTRYTNYILHPQFSYRIIMPEDHVGALSTYEWPVDGVRADASIYWIPGKTQYTKWPSVSTRKTRIHMPISPLDLSNTDWFYSLTGIRSSYGGISRFQVDTPAVPASAYLTSGLWSASNCTLSFAGNVATVTITGASPYITINLASWAYEPYMLASICNAFTIATTDAALVSTLIGYDNAISPLGVGAGTFSKTTGANAKYAGSWANDLGCGVVTDTGADTKPPGISSTVMADPSAVDNFQLLSGELSKTLKLVPSANCTISVTCNPATGNKVFWENAHYAALVFSSGPGIRYGGLDFNDSGSIRTTPIIADYPQKTSVLDWLCFRNLFLLGTDTSTVAAEIASWYDSTEGQTVANAAASTLSFIYAGPKAGLVNSYSETIPPLAYWPRKKRVDLVETGDYALEWWHFAQENKYTISTVSLDVSVSSSTWTSLHESYGIWTINKYNHAVENTESGIVIGGGSTIATIRPFSGWFGLLYLATKDHPAVTHNGDGVYWLAYVDGASIRVARADYGSPGNGWAMDVLAVANGSQPAIDSHHGMLSLAFVYNGDSYLYVSSDYGATWRDLGIFMASTYYPRLRSNPNGDRIYIGFRYDTGTSGNGKLYKSYKGSGDTTWSTPAPIKDSAGADLSVVDSVFDFSYGFLNGRWVFAVKKAGSTDVTNFISFDNGTSVREC
jgi:hypothetical protein